MSDQQKQELERELWNIADILRGKMDADEFRDYILGFIFYKYLSERMETFAEKLLETEKEIKEYQALSEEKHSAYIEAIQEEAIKELGYFLKPTELFSYIAQKGTQEKDNFIIEDLGNILKSIEQSTQGQESEEEFINLFEDLDLTSNKLGKTPKDRNAIIAKVIAQLNKIDFRLEDSDADILGDAYEYLIGQFASGAGKKAGEFYTPQQVSKILAKLVTFDPKTDKSKPKIKTAYDPTCGSGSLLLRIAKETDVSMFYGQELNRTTYNLARMNMILHEVHYNRFDIRQDDTLENPQHRSEDFDLRAEAIVANPPFSAKWTANQTFASDERFSAYGKLAPKTKADFAFVQHMIYHLAENGTMAIVLPHGVLFRGSAEKQIRTYLIEEKNYLDAVIGLPANIFYGTSIPTCILVFKKCREDAKNILFIDASQHFEKAKNQNYLREIDIEKIVDTFAKRETKDKYSYLASLEEVAENDYNLNIPRYVDTFEEEEPVDLQAVAQNIKNLENEGQEIDNSIAEFCRELNIETPF